MPDNIYTKEQREKIRTAFMEIFFGSLNILTVTGPTKPELDDQLEELVYPLGDSPRSVKAFLRQDGKCRLYYRRYEGLTPLPDTVESLINESIFSPLQLDTEKLRTVVGTPIDYLRESKGLPNPMSEQQMETLCEEVDAFAEDIATRGHQKEWKAIADSIGNQDYVGEIDNSRWEVAYRHLKSSYSYNKGYFFSVLLRFLVIIIVTVGGGYWIISTFIATF